MLLNICLLCFWEGISCSTMYVVLKLWAVCIRVVILPFIILYTLHHKPYSLSTLIMLLYTIDNFFCENSYAPTYKHNHTSVVKITSVNWQCNFYFKSWIDYSTNTPFFITNCFNTVMKLSLRHCNKWVMEWLLQNYWHVKM